MEEEMIITCIHPLLQQLSLLIYALKQVMSYVSPPLSKLVQQGRGDVTFCDENAVPVLNGFSSHEMTICHSASILGMPRNYSVGESLDEESVLG